MNEAYSGKGRILVAEDDEQVRAGIERALTNAGYQVDTAPDGLTASKLLKQQSYDLVVTDIRMPGVDGMTVMRLARDRDLDLPVVLIAGQPSISTAVEAVEFGALRYLIKPFEMATLVALADNGVGLYRLARIKRQVFEELETTPISGDRVGLTISLDRALSGLWMAYQPIVAQSPRSLFAYEALMRSSEPTLPHPGAILHAAERLGRMVEVGRTVRRKVAEFADDAPGQTFFVNLHTLDLQDPDLFDEHSPLARHSSRIVLELTERAALDNVSDVAKKMALLRELGYRIAVDDLGAGYAGLTTFAQVEPEIVKLDMSLVRDIHRKPTRKALVVALLNACQNLGVTVVAEGVETKNEYDVLAQAGVDLLQGYYFGRPTKELQIPDWLAHEELAAV